MPVEGSRHTFVLLEGEQAGAKRIAGLSRDAVFTRSRTVEELNAIFRETDAVFSDADGTLLPIGGDTLPPEQAAYIQRIDRLGVRTTMVTGKPYSEVERILERLPAGFPLGIIYEKGAYIAVRCSDGSLRPEYLLSSSDIERMIALIRRDVLDWGERTGRGRGWRFVLAGHGTHKSLLSIDVLARNSTGSLSARDGEKLRDHVLLGDIKISLQERLQSDFPGCVLVDLGNSNWEITVGQIDKDAAIIAIADFQSLVRIQIWGDSGNDEKMLSLCSRPHINSGVVFHSFTPERLLNGCDFFSVGVMNSKPFFDAISYCKGVTK